MLYLFSFIVIAFSMLMFISESEKKIAILYLSSFLFTAVVIPFLPSFKGAQTWLMVCFILSEFKSGLLMSRLKINIPRILILCLQILFLSSIILLIFSPHLLETDTLQMFVQKEYLTKYCAIYAACLCVQHEDSLRIVYRYAYISMLILTSVGILNYISGSSVIINEITANWNQNDSMTALGEMYVGLDRFRVQSLFVNPFNYGYMCCLVALFFTFGYIRGIVSKRYFYIVILCSLFGILTCGCRTIIVCAVIAFSAFFLLVFKFGRFIRISILALIASIAMYESVPLVQERVDQVLSITKNENEIGSSSLEMRLIQYETAYSYVTDDATKFLFGNGFNYINDDLGKGGGRSEMLDSRLQSLEGVILRYLIERGFVGVLLYFAFYIVLIVYMYKRKEYDRLLLGFGISALVLYLAFANFTGEQLSTFPTLLLVGATLGIFNTNMKNIYAE